MITYEVKITVETAVVSSWLHWMKTVHVPDVIATGLVRSFQIMQSRDRSNEFTFHYHFDHQDDLDVYNKDYAPALKAHPQEKFPDKFKAERAIYDWI
ncbi:MAG: DUF4286 family protein [Bacteroidota bacterium]